MKIFLDDTRNPIDCMKYMKDRMGTLLPIYTEEWVTVRNHREFVNAISENIDKITHISFDHDLSDIHIKKSTYKEKTGVDCAKFVDEHYKLKNKELPIMFVHSMNPIGTKNIVEVFKRK